MSRKHYSPSNRESPSGQRKTWNNLPTLRNFERQFSGGNERRLSPGSNVKEYKFNTTHGRNSGITRNSIAKTEEFCPPNRSTSKSCQLIRYRQSSCKSPQRTSDIDSHMKGRVCSLIAPSPNYDLIPTKLPKKCDNENKKGFDRFFKNKNVLLDSRPESANCPSKVDAVLKVHFSSSKLIPENSFKKGEKSTFNVVTSPFQSTSEKWLVNVKNIETLRFDTPKELLSCAGVSVTAHAEISNQRNESSSGPDADQKLHNYHLYPDKNKSWRIESDNGEPSFMRSLPASQRKSSISDRETLESVDERNRSWIRESKEKMRKSAEMSKNRPSSSSQSWKGDSKLKESTMIPPESTSKSFNRSSLPDRQTFGSNMGPTDDRNKPWRRDTWENGHQSVGASMNRHSTSSQMSQYSDMKQSLRGDSVARESSMMPHTNTSGSINTSSLSARQTFGSNMEPTEERQRSWRRDVPQPPEISVIRPSTSTQVDQNDETKKSWRGDSAIKTVGSNMEPTDEKQRSWRRDMSQSPRISVTRPSTSSQVDQRDENKKYWRGDSATNPSSLPRQISVSDRQTFESNVEPTDYRNRSWRRESLENGPTEVSMNQPSSSFQHFKRASRESREETSGNERLSQGNTSRDFNSFNMPHADSYSNYRSSLQSVSSRKSGNRNSEMSSIPDSLLYHQNSGRASDLSSVENGDTNSYRSNRESETRSISSQGHSMLMGHGSTMPSMQVENNQNYRPSQDSNTYSLQNTSFERFSNGYDSVYSTNRESRDSQLSRQSFKQSFDYYSPTSPRKSSLDQKEKQDFHKNRSISRESEDLRQLILHEHPIHYHHKTSGSLSKTLEEHGRLSEHSSSIQNEVMSHAEKHRYQSPSTSRKSSSSLRDLETMNESPDLRGSEAHARKSSYGRKSHESFGSAVYKGQAMYDRMTQGTIESFMDSPENLSHIRESNTASSRVLGKSFPFKYLNITSDTHESLQSSSVPHVCQSREGVKKSESTTKPDQHFEKPYSKQDVREVLDSDQTKNLQWSRGLSRQSNRSDSAKDPLLPSHRESQGPPRKIHQHRFSSDEIPYSNERSHMQPNINDPMWSTAFRTSQGLFPPCAPGNAVPLQWPPPGRGFPKCSVYRKYKKHNTRN